MGKHDKWTAQELQILRKLYSNTSNNELSGVLGRTKEAIQTKASLLKLNKNPEQFPQGRNPLKFIIKQQQEAGYLQQSGNSG